MTLVAVRMLAVAWTVLCFMFFLVSYVQTGEQQVAIALLCLVSLVVTWGLFAAALGRGSPTTHGSAAWADRRSLKGLLHKKGTPEPGGLLLGLHDRRHVIVLPLHLARLHVLIVGGSGSGKTWGFFLPNAAQAAGSFVAIDPKGELWKHTSGYHQRAWRFAPREPDASRAFNWIPLCREEYVARLLAAAALQVEEDPHEEQFWKLAELQLCAALLGFAAHSSTPTPATAYQLLRLGPTGLLDALRQSQSATARTCAALLAERKPEARAGIVLGVANKLAFLEDPVVRRFTSADLKAPNFGELAEEPVVAYWVVHEQDAALLQPLFALFFTLLLDQLSRCEPGVVPITLFLDELANIGRIPHFPTIISVARGRGLSLVLGVQALSQLDGLYGHAGAETIRTNCATKVVLHGLDYHSAEEISRALGETTVLEELASRRPSDHLFTSDVTHSEHHSPRRLLTADEVRRIGDDQAVLIISNLPPVLARRHYWDRPPRAAITAGLGREQGAPSPDPGRTTTGRPPANIAHLRTKLRELEHE